MSEQMMLSGFESKPDIMEELEVALQQARDTYGYYELHKSGYYEMGRDPKLKPGDMVKILDISQNKDSYSAKIFGQIFFKLDVKKFAVHIPQDANKEYNFANETEQSNLKKFVKINPENEDKALEIFRKVLDYTIDNYIPVARFGCCSKYAECSAAKKCLHENLFYAKGCFFRSNLENENISC